MRPESSDETCSCVIDVSAHNVLRARRLARLDGVDQFVVAVIGILS
jgi:hypothetical protein